MAFDWNSAKKQEDSTTELVEVPSFDWSTAQAKQPAKQDFSWDTAKLVEEGQETIPKGNAVSAKQGLVVAPRTKQDFGDEQAIFTQEGSGMAKPKILDVIGNKEAPLGYNQVYGRNKEAPLTTMTVNDVLDYQKELVAGGSPSSAVGRYQFISKTLNELKRTQGLSGDELFTEELQDTLAQALLKRRGYDKYKAGKISKLEFANNLAKEWASLPVVTGEKKGKSYYAGDGLNKALIDVDSVLAALEEE